MFHPIHGLSFIIMAVMVMVNSAAYAATVKVGLLLPRSSVYAALGNEIDDGFVFALEEAGILDQVEIIRDDTEVKPATGLAKARKLIYQDRVDVIVGVVSSGVLGAMRDFIHQSKTPLIVSNAGNDHATGSRCSPYIVRVSFSNSQINRPMGAWLVGQGVDKIYTLASDYSAGHQMIEAFTTAYKAAGGEIVGGGFTPFRKTKDYGPYLAKAKASGADGVFVFYAGSEAISFVKQHDAFGLKESLPLYGSGFLTSPLYVKAEGAAAEGVITSLHYIPTLDTPENKDFIAAFTARFDRTPSEYAVQGYDSGRLLAEAIKMGARDREALTALLPKIAYTGPRGPLTIDPETNNIVQNIYVYETVAGPAGLTQKLLSTIANVRDPRNDCVM